MGGGGTKNYQDDYYSNNQDNCATLTISALVQNVQPGLAKVETGDKLSITVDSANVVTIFNSEGEPCGNLISPRIIKLANCITEGHNFHVIVLSKNGEICDVRVENTISE